MNLKEQLTDNIDKIHTTNIGITRISKNINLDDSTDVVEYCKNIIKDAQSQVTKKGKKLLCNIQ